MIEEIEQRIAQLQQVNVSNLLNEVIKSLEKEIINFNTFDQLYEKGIKTSGESLPGYRPYTVKIKKEKNQRYDHMTLKDTGDFYGAWFIKIQKEYFTLGSTDRKALKLQTDYSPLIIGLSDESLEKLRILVRPLMIEALRKQLE